MRGYPNLNAVLDGSTTRFAEARQVARDGLAYAEQVGWTSPVPDFLRLNLVEGLRTSGLLVEADRHLERVTRRFEPVAFVAHQTATTAKVRVDQGHVEDAREVLGRSRELLRGIWDPQFRLSLAEAEALAALAATELDEAWEVLAAVRGLSPDRARYEKIRPLAARVEAERAAGRTSDETAVRQSLERIDALREDLDAMLDAEEGGSFWATQLRTARAQVEAERTRAAGAPDPDAWARAEPGVAAQERLAELGYLRMRRAEALVATGHRAEAATLLEDVHGDAVERGLGWLAEQVRALARRARVTLPGTVEPDGDPFGLTPREREVLSLVSLGLTNREIGERLFIADKTASVHVSNILAKLHATTRGEAALVARRHGLDGGVGPSPEQPAVVRVE
jgi:DNA-binding CsgD family transcriptional regulator